jgi:hypothetical protein
LKYSTEVDLRILLDRLRLLTDSLKALNGKRYSQWTDLEVAQIAFPMCTYASEMMEILDNEDFDVRYRDNYQEQGEPV